MQRAPSPGRTAPSNLVGNRTSPRSFPWPIQPGILAILVIVAFTLPSLIGWMSSVHPTLTTADLQSASWVQRHASPDARFLIASDDPDHVEWLPYVLRRTPTIAYWGAEWTGRFDTQSRLFTTETTCMRRQSLLCLQRLIQKHRLRADYLIAPNVGRYPRLRAELRHSSSWTPVYHNRANSIWRSAST